MQGKALYSGPLGPELISRMMSLADGDADAGAVSVFIGRVRSDRSENRQVTAIEYSAYPEMVEKEIAEIESEIKASFTDVREFFAVHSEGVVKAGEASLFIMITAGHRDHATKACRETLEKIKERLPVWKKEIYDDASARWKEE